MKRTIMLTACVFGVLAVALGAFGAHGLKNLVDENAVSTFETGVRYQMYHAFFFVCAWLDAGYYVKGKKAYLLVYLNRGGFVFFFNLCFSIERLGAV